MKSQILLLLISLSLFCNAQNASNQTSEYFEKEITKQVQAEYLCYLPKKYETKDSWPLILFLHGAGERGTNLHVVAKHGPPSIVKEKDMPFIIISPQCPPKIWWDTDTLNALLDIVIEKYKVDEKRIYLTGLSMGGYATWNMALTYPSRFAAIAPICGGADPDKAHTIKDMPIWVFHGKLDPVVKFKESDNMVKALKKAGSKVKFTVYEKGKHNVWKEAYSDQKLYKWFLKHKIK
jgi:predicted peptidase